MRRELVLWLACAFVPSGVADAATIVVKIGGPIATIQAGINAASAGDTVLVMPGTYRETPTIPPMKTGLVVRGKGKVVVDARDPDGTSDGAAIVVQSSDVTIERMTLRHAAFEGTEGHGVLAIADGLILRKVTITHCSQYGVRVVGDRLSMSKCTVTQSFGGVSVDGSEAIIDGCTFTNLEDHAVDADGSQLTVRKNVVRDCTAGGFLAVNATSSGFLSNVLDSIGGTGIDATGTSLTVAKNKLTGCDEGIDLTGLSGVVEGNVVRETQGRAIGVDGLSATVKKNRVERAIGQGMFVLGDSAVFEGNTAIRCGDFGIGLSGNSGALTKNVALDCCVGGEGAGISVLGTSCSLMKNVARRCGDGIRINGSSGYLGGNVSSANAVDGYEIAGGTVVTLEKNVALGNGAEGIDNEGTSTTLTGNVCKGNRLDIASANALLLFVDNVYVTGGPGQAPEID